MPDHEPKQQNANRYRNRDPSTHSSTILMATTPISSDLLKLTPAPIANQNIRTKSRNWKLQSKTPGAATGAKAEGWATLIEARIDVANR